MATVGIHLVWTCYGTWLPGDDRGHWSPLFDLYGNIMKKGGQLNRADLTTRQNARERMIEPPKSLNDEERRIIAETIGRVARENRIGVIAAAIEETHIHLLLTAIEEHIGTAAGRFKGTTSSALLDLPLNQGRTKIWTAKYWKVFLFSESALDYVQLYVEEHNVRRGLGQRPYDWLM